MAGRTRRMRVVLVTVISGIALFGLAWATGVVSFRYRHIIEDEPLKSPVKVVGIEGDRLILEDGRTMEFENWMAAKGTSAEALAQSNFQVDLELLRDGTYAVWARQDGWICGTGWHQLIVIPIFKVTEYRDRRQPVGRAREISGQKLLVAGNDGMEVKTFINAEFDFWLEYPANWYAVPSDKTADLRETVHRKLMEENVVSSPVKGRQLLLISKFPFPSSVPTPGLAVLLIVAEELPDSATPVTDGRAYLTAVRDLYAKVENLEVRFDGEPYKYPINGVEYYRLDYAIRASDMDFKFSSLATISGSYAFGVTLTGQSDPEMSELERIVKTLRFGQGSADKAEGRRTGL